MLTQEQKNSLVEFFRQQGVVVAYAFGSQIQGSATTTSDTDIAILLPEHMSKEKRFDYRLRMAGELSKKLDTPVDLVVLNDTSSLFFKYTIISEGLCLFARDDGERVAFEAALMSEYFDFEPFLDQYHAHYVQTHL